MDPLYARRSRRKIVIISSYWVSVVLVLLDEFEDRCRSAVCGVPTCCLVLLFLQQYIAVRVSRLKFVWRLFVAYCTKTFLKSNFFTHA